MNYTNLLYLFLSFSYFISDYLILPFIFILYFMKKISFIKYSIIFYTIIVLLMFIHILINPIYFNLSLYLHLLLLIFITISVKDKYFTKNSFLKTIKLITTINFILLFTYFSDEGRTLFFYENLESYRFRSFYLEPSILALFSVFNFIIIDYYDDVKNKIYFLILNLLILLFTFSGSGIIVFFFIYTWRFFKKINLKYIIILLIFVLIFVLNIKYLPDSFILRVNMFFLGSYDTSTILRFFAPIEYFSIITFDNFSNFLFGIGDPRIYLEYNFSSFNLFYLWNGEATYNINNGYVVGYSMGGIVLLITILFHILYYFNKNKYPILFFIILFPFFSGHFVSIYLWFLFYIYRHRFYKSNKGIISYEKNSNY